MLSPNDKKKDDNLEKTFREVSPYLGLGLQLAVTIVAAVFFGDWLDKKYLTSPLYTIIFAILGVFVGLYSLIKTVLYNEKKKSNEKNKLS